MIEKLRILSLAKDLMFSVLIQSKRLILSFKVQEKSSQLTPHVKTSWHKQISAGKQRKLYLSLTSPLGLRNIVMPTIPERPSNLKTLHTGTSLAIYKRDCSNSHMKLGKDFTLKNQDVTKEFTCQQANLPVVSSAEEENAT